MPTYPDQKPSADGPSDSARQAGRGAIALSLAKLYFIALGLIQTVVLAWVLRDTYGALRGVLSPAGITYNPLVSVGIQGMSRAVSQAPKESQAATIRSALRIHALLAVIAATGFFCLAPWLGIWLNSEYLVPGFRVLSLVVLFYGLYAPLVGILNGQRRFLLQAGLDAIAATIKAVALVAGAWLFLAGGATAAVVGASWGFTLVSLTMGILAVIATGIGKRGKAHKTGKAHLAFIGPVLLGQIVLNLLLQADTNTLRAFATRAAEAEELMVTEADALVAAYNCGQLFAFLPYQVLIGLTFMLFPMLAKAQAEGDSKAIGRYVQEGLRLATLLVGLLVGITSGLSESLLRLVFPPQFGELGAPSMQLLTLGLGLFGLFGVLCTVLNSLGRQWQTLGITTAGLAAVVSLNYAVVSGTSFGPELLYKTAIATSSGVALATLLSGFAVFKAAGQLVHWLVPARVGLAMTVCIFLGRALPTQGRVMTLVCCVGLALTYFGILVLVRELRRSDLAFLKSIAR